MHIAVPESITDMLCPQTVIILAATLLSAHKVPRSPTSTISLMLCVVFKIWTEEVTLLLLS